MKMANIGADVLEAEKRRFDLGGELALCHRLLRDARRLGDTASRIDLVTGMIERGQLRFKYARLICTKLPDRHLNIKTIGGQRLGRVIEEFVVSPGGYAHVSTYEISPSLAHVYARCGASFPAWHLTEWRRGRTWNLCSDVRFPVRVCTRCAKGVAAKGYRMVWEVTP